MDPRSNLRTGPGLRSREIAGQTLLAARPTGWRWDAAWGVLRGADFITVSYGTVNGVEPTVKGIRISGELKKAAPQIALPKTFDSEGRAWVAVRVTVDAETGKIPVDEENRPEKDSVTVVTTSLAGDLMLEGQADTDALFPIALLTKAGRIHQLAYYHLQHARVKPPADNLDNDAARWQHVFW